jgi:hypothetical protein
MATNCDIADFLSPTREYNVGSASRANVNAKQLPENASLYKITASQERAHA